RTKARRAIPARVHVSSDLSSRFDLSQATMEVARRLQHPLKCLPGPAFDFIGRPVFRLSSHVRRHSRVGGANGSPVSEIPGLELLDCDSIDNHVRLSRRRRARLEASVARKLLQPFFQLGALIGVAIHDYNDSPRLWNPRGIAAEALRKA